MGIDLSLQTSVDKSADVRPLIQLTGSNIKVIAGQFVVNGVSYQLQEDQEHDIQAKSNKSWLVGYLVKQVSDQSVHLLVDHYEDPQVERYQFDDGVYERLWLLFAVTLPPNETDVENNVDLQVLYIQPADEEV